MQQVGSRRGGRTAADALVGVGNRRAQGRADAVLGTAELTIHGQVDRGLALSSEGWTSRGNSANRTTTPWPQSVCRPLPRERSAPAGRTVSQELRHRLLQLAPDGDWMDGMMRAIQIEALVATGAWDAAVTVGSEGPDVVGFTEMAIAVVHALRGDFARASSSLRNGARLDRRSPVLRHLPRARSILALQEDHHRRALGEALLAEEVCAEYHDIAVASRLLLLTGLRAAVLLGDGGCSVRCSTRSGWSEPTGSAPSSQPRSRPSDRCCTGPAYRSSGRRALPAGGARYARTRPRSHGCGSPKPC